MASPSWREQNLADDGDELDGDELDESDELDEGDWFPDGGSVVTPDEHSGPRLSRPADGAGVPFVPEFADAGYLPRGTASGPTAWAGRPGLERGFASGNVLDTAVPGPALAGFADAAAGPGWGYPGLNDDELIGVLAAWQKTEAWAAAGRLSAVAELIRRRPGDLTGPLDAGGPLADGAASGSNDSDHAHGPGVAPIPPAFGKFCADELAVALACSRWAAERMLALAHDLGTRLPLTAQALRDGVIDAYKAQIIAEATRVLDDAGAGAAEALVIPGAGGQTPGQIRVRIGRAVLKADPGAGRARREQAQKDARVELWREDAGTAALCGYNLPPDEALAADQVIQARARELKGTGMGGTMNQLRARAYLDVLLGKDSTVTPVQPDPGTTGSRALAARINLTIPLATLLGLADHPGEAVSFGPLDADLARDMANRAAAHPATGWCVTLTDQHGHPIAHGCANPPRRRKPKRRTGRGSGPPGKSAGPRPGLHTGPPWGYGTWRLRPTVSGPDLAVDLEPIAVTSCDHRHETAAHDPSDRLRHLVEIRDGTCTWPPCQRAARRCDFEHAIPWEDGGRTCACNAGPRCRHHHHQKQAVGWQLEQNQPGSHIWTTPSGRIYTSRPTSYPI